MARANRHYIPDCIWHITHRCHKREFLLKFKKDKKIWIKWLFEAKKRYGLRILNYAVTSNHIHLLVVDPEREVISKSIQLLAGRTAREFNLRKKRKGAFWEDRYHATAVQDGSHLMQCLVYIDMNMVRAGVVRHPSQWPYCGYNEIMTPPKRYALIDSGLLVSLCGRADAHQFRDTYRALIEAEIQKDSLKRKSFWTESIAVGDEQFIKKMKAAFGVRAKGRKIKKRCGVHMIREDLSPYHAVSGPGPHFLNGENSYFWPEPKPI